MRAKGKSLAEQFAAALAARDEANREFEKVRGAYFYDRRIRAKGGEDLEPLVCDPDDWQRQLHSESVARSNGEQDRLAGLAA
jgi:hypothetical protein